MPTPGSRSCVTTTALSMPRAQGAVSHRLKTGSWKGAGQAALEGMGDGALTGAITGAIQGGISGYSGYLKNGACFVAGTLVATATGYVAIEKIRAGDLVWAWDEKTGDVALKPVVETYINETTELTHIFVSGEEIVATPTHPFYCPVKGWTDAAHLRAGDILVLVNGEYVVVEKVQHELLESPVKVYNFQVADYHTYYVGTDGVLVHNRCGNDFKKYTPEKIADYLDTSVNDFHRSIKPKILTDMRSELKMGQLAKVGRTPDINLRTADGAIKVASTVTKGAGYVLKKTIWEIIS